MRSSLVVKPAEPGRRRMVLGCAAALGLAGLPGAALAAHATHPWPQAKPVPPLELADLESKPWRLEALAGHVVVLNFWATWCEPCRLEMPSLEAMAVRRRREGVIVAAVNYREAADVIRSFLERQPFKPPILLDPEGDATAAWTPRVFPSTVLIGRDGRPAQTVLGELDWDSAEARALLDPLVAVRRKPG